MENNLIHFFESNLLYNNKYKSLIFIEANSEKSFFKQAHIKCVGFELIIAYIESNKLILSNILIHLEENKHTYKDYHNYITELNDFAKEYNLIIDYSMINKQKELNINWKNKQNELWKEKLNTNW